MNTVPENIIWQCLSGAHARFSVGTPTARRYDRGFSPIIGFADVIDPDFEALAPFCESGEHFYCGGWSGSIAQGWRLEAESSMHQMVWEGRKPREEPAMQAVALGAQHVEQVLALVALTQPGPFGPRTLELGEYFGFFEGARLVAMAGERMQAGKVHEISAICTHPEFQGRGLARQLTTKLIYRQMERGQTPFLHVMRDNTNALALYQAMGFRTYRDAVVRVLARE